MRSFPLLSRQSIALTLIVTVTWVTGAQMQGEAMLVPTKALPTAQQTRSEDVAVIQKALESKILKSKLKTLGLSDADIESRLSKMSDQQIHQFASQIRSVHPAGDGIVYILVVVVLVLFIIYLFKRV